MNLPLQFKDGRRGVLVVDLGEARGGERGTMRHDELGKNTCVFCDRVNRAGSGYLDLPRGDSGTSRRRFFLSYLAVMRLAMTHILFFRGMLASEASHLFDIDVPD